jgi:hypothetical protein
LIGPAWTLIPLIGGPQAVIALPLSPFSPLHSAFIIHHNRRYRRRYFYFFNLK